MYIYIYIYMCVCSCSASDALAASDLVRSVSIISIFEFSIWESQIRTNWLRMFFWHDVGFQCARVSAQKNTMKFRKSTVLMNFVPVCWLSRNIAFVFPFFTQTSMIVWRVLVKQQLKHHKMFAICFLRYVSCLRSPWGDSFSNEILWKIRGPLRLAYWGAVNRGFGNRGFRATWRMFDRDANTLT